MIKICRAEDGQVFQANASIRDIEGIGSLELFLHQEIGVDQDAALAYLSDGRRLTSANIRDLGTMQDQFIFVFDKRYFEHDIEDVLRQLHVEAVFQPSVDDAAASTPPIRHAQLATSYARTSHMHHEHIQHLVQSLQLQHQAIRIAYAGLDQNVLAIVETFEAIASGARKDLEKQAGLLEGLDADLDLISKVTVHAEFCSAAVRMAIEAGERHRVLVDYVSQQKMKQVADTCARTHDDLKIRFHQMELSVHNLRAGADEVRVFVNDISLLEEAEALFRRSQDILDRITDAAATLESPASNADALFPELRILDNTHRQELQLIVNKKNLYTHHCLTVLRHISTLNNEIIHLPTSLTDLSNSFRAKTSFSHIQRLHSMLYAYGATVVEIVRRKEFSRFFFQRAQGILEVMAKVSANERKRRQIYRGEVHGQLPFDTRGMDDPVPTIDFSPTGSTEAFYSFERSDVDGLLLVLDDLETHARSSNSLVAVKAVGECRASLEKLITKMDNLETGFDKIAERSLLSASRLSHSRRRSTEADERAFHELAEELRLAHQTHAHRDAQFKEERSGLQGQIHQFKSSLAEADSSVAVERERAARLERELHQVRAQMESEAVARKVLEERNTELSADIVKQRNEIARALTDATEQTKQAEILRQELRQVKSDFEEVKQMEIRHAEKVDHLLEEQSNHLQHLEEARSRGEDLELQIQAARAESGDVQHTLKAASMEKDRLLKLQASEHERIMRDHRAEADGDRAVLDRRFSELEAVLEHDERQLKDLRGDLEVANADAVGLREELQRVEHELREARHVERLLRDDLRAGRASQSDFEQRMEHSSRLVAQILDVGISFRNSHLKALHVAQSMTSHPNSARHGPNNIAESTFSAPGFRHHVIGHSDAEPPPIDPSDPSAALDILRDFDHDNFLEAVSKTGSTIRKWQKQCKEYRERAKGKISFRNFAKGDLALFLPTRNSVSKPWAAFNVSFPHYFLQAAGHLAEQLKSREWIVARITSITERVVDQKDPTSNPYGLGDGVKYYMLEVEDWTQPSHHKRKPSSRKVSADNEFSIDTSSMQLSPSKLPPGLPEAEVEDTFQVVHPPNSRLFPVRARSNSSPTARPSSLSRLLAQASSASENPIEVPPIPLPEIPSPAASPPPPPSPSHKSFNTESAPQSHFPNLPSPLRPGSPSSRVSNASRFSGRIPTIGTIVSGSQTKAAPTTALTDQPIASSSPVSTDGNPFRSPIAPTPNELLMDGMASLVRRRTTSYQAPRASPLASSSAQPTTVTSAKPGLAASTTLSTLASNWGMAFGRKKKSDLGNLVLTAESPVDASESVAADSNKSAREPPEQS